MPGHLPDGESTGMFQQQPAELNGCSFSSRVRSWSALFIDLSILDSEPSKPKFGKQEEARTLLRGCLMPAMA